MAGLRTVIIVAVLMALILAVVGEKNRRFHSRNTGGYGHSRPCTNNPQMNPYYPPCGTTSTAPITTPVSSTTTISSTTTVAEDSSEETSTDTTSQPSSLERSHWCRFSNGSYVPLGYTYMNNVCTMCQCTTSRAIRCQALQCMPTYCFDNTMPSRRSGQCCTQCSYDVAANSCLYNGISYPHGVIMKTVEYKSQCWCQLGNIECRNYFGSLIDSLSMFADGAAIYIIVMVICIVLLFGLLLCCGCTFFIYYYYNRNQQVLQQAYDQYINSAGWQPMNEEEQNVTDATAEEKRLEAEENQFSNFINESVPPPYAVYNNPYVSVEEQKQM